MWLSFAPEAQPLFDQWRSTLERRLRSGELSPALESHLAKYRSFMPSLAGLWELAAGAAAGVLPSRISPECTRQAIQLCAYFESHARRVYSCVISPQIKAARDLAGKIKRHEIGADGAFTLREVYLKGWSGLDDPVKARAAADVLADAGWLRRVDAGLPDPLGRGRPSDRYQINPRIWE